MSLDGRRLLQLVSVWANHGSEDCFIRCDVYTTHELFTQYWQENEL